MSAIVVTGTDTDIGKTVASAMLVQGLSASYWKPLQCGLPRDSETVATLADTARIIPEAHVFSQPLSPHRAAELDNVVIAPEKLSIPAHEGRLIVEGAGGLMVPVTRELLQVDLFARWKAPLILCARTGLGTINHTLLSIEAIKARKLPFLGIIFIGDAMEDSEATITHMSGAKRLGRIPRMGTLTPQTLKDCFTTHFSAQDFA